MKNVFSHFPLCFVLFSMPAPAEQSARELLDKARDYLESAPMVRRIDTTEQSAVVMVGKRRVEQEPQTNVVTIEIDRANLLARETAAIQGKPLVMLRRGEKAAMKLGDGPWETPRGPYENLAKDLGNLFVCEIETPETRENGPVWKLAGTEWFDGHEAFVIESEGTNGVALAQERMAKGIAKAFSGNPSQRPAIKVLKYSSKHWISKSDYRHLQAVQISKVQLTIVLPDGKEQLIEQSSKATSRYSFEKVAIEITAEAQKVLSTGGPAELPARRGIQALGRP